MKVMESCKRGEFSVYYLDKRTEGSGGAKEGRSEGGSGGRGDGEKGSGQEEGKSGGEKEEPKFHQRAPP